MENCRQTYRTKFHPRNQLGFTLIEILVVIALFAVITTILVPNTRSWLPGIRLKSASQELFSDMYRAKTEAIKRNRNVVINFVTVNCQPTVPSGSGSYRIFVDDGAGGGIAGNNIQDGTEITIVQKTMPDSVALCSENETFGGQTGFTSRGLPIALNNGAIQLMNTFTTAYTMTLNVAGGVTLN